MSGKSTSRKSLIVSESVQRQVKVRAAALGRSVQSVVEEALSGWLNETARVTDVDRTRVSTVPTCLWCRAPMYDQSGAWPYCSDGCRQASQATNRREGTPS